MVNTNILNKENKPLKVAVIGGSGKMGQWFAGFLRQEGFDVMISGRNREKLLAAGRRLGISAVSNEEAVRLADVVILSVPINNFEDVVEGIAPHVRAGQIISDITSVKVMPVDIMHQYLKNAVILGTHPLFGPGAKGVANMNFVLTPIGEKERATAQEAKSYLEARGGRVSVMTPAAHDEMMTVILGLSHFIALAAADTLSNVKDLGGMKAAGGITFKVLLTLIESVVSEDPELYAAIQLSLNSLPDLEKRFEEKACEWAEMVRNGDKKQFVDRMQALQKVFEKNADFGKSYEDMYKLAEKRDATSA